MGVNIVPKLMNFRIDTTDFRKGSGDPSADLGCISEGKHRVMRFMLECHNKGDKDLVLGNPADRPDLFVSNPITGWAFKEKFYTWRLKNDAGIEKRGYKVAFCLMDFGEHRKYDCAKQGISAGGHDEYMADLPCQFVEIDDLPDGKYVFEATANAYFVEQAKTGKGKVLIEEDNYDDNTVSIQLQIKENKVEII
jgi:hypothetical protein